MVFFRGNTILGQSPLCLLAPTGLNKTVTVPVFDQLDHYRIGLEHPASVVRISGSS